MKKIITIILLTFVVSISFAQQYTPMTAAGYQMKRLKVDSTLHIPSFCGVPTTRNSTAKEGAVAMDTCNNLLYKWTNASGWSSISGGTIVDTAAINAAIALRVKYTDTAGMLQPYLRKIDTTNKWVQSVTKLNDSTIRVVKNAITTDLLIRGNGVKYSDTAAMLSPYLRKVDTATLSNRINLKLNLSDTATMLSKYLRKADTASLSSRINLKLNISDTATMLSKYLRKTDTASLSNRINLKLNISDTSAMLSKYLRKTDTASLSARINTKLAIADTVNKWVQDVTKLNDSTIRVRKNNTNTDIILPKGTGGGGTFVSPNLQQVTDSGNTTTNSIEVDFLQTNGDVLAGKLGAGGGVVIDDGSGFSGRIEATNLITFPTLYLPNASGTFAMSVNGNFADSSGNISLSTGSGTVSSISQGYGIINSPNPITTTGTVTVDTATLSTKYLRLTDTTFANLQSVLNKGNTATGKSMRLYSSAISGANLFMNANYPNIYPYKDAFHYALLSADNTISTSRPQLYIQGGTGNDSTQISVLSDSISFDKFGTIGNNGAGLRYNNKNLFSLRADSIALNQKNTSSDTTTYKPIGINGNGKIAKMSSWGSSGGSSTAYVDSIYRTIGKDSIFYKKNGNTYAIKDSVGTGGGGAGSSVSYYLNGGTAASVATYYQMSNTAVVGTNADFSLAGNGLISQWLTDVGNPNQLQIAAGNWNFEMYMSASSSGGTPGFYVQLLKYDGSTFTSIASSSVVPENISGGTSIDLYLTSLAIPQTTLLATDRLAIRVYIVNSVGGRTITMHTQDSHLCQIITNFSSGISALNGLTATTQTFATGTDSSDFKIVSSGNIHTFNLPTASSTKRGALSSTDWSTFNGKIGASDTSVFQRKSISSYSIMANNTAAAANTTALPYVSATDAAYTGIVTFTGTAPTTSVLRYTWSRIGNIINFRFDFGYTNAGFITAVAWEFPSDMPQPTFNSNFVTQPTPYIFIGGTSLTIATAITQRSCLLTRNTGNTAWQFSMATFSGTNTRYFTMFGYYFVN